MRRTSLLTATTCGLLLAMVGCNFDSTEPDLVFSNDRVPVTDLAPSFARVVAIGEGLIVSGTISTPSECYSLRPRLSQAADRITITVHAAVTSSTCTRSVTGAHSYSLSTTRYHAGEYQVKVIHTVDSNAIPAKTAAEQRVRIN